MKRVPHHSHPPNVYASGPLDRGDKLRMDAEALAAALAHEAARLVPVWRGRSLVMMGERMSSLRPSASRTEILSIVEETVFLGFDPQGAPHFAVDLSDHEEPPQLDENAAFEDLRKVGPLLAEDEGSILAYARGLVHWNQRHRYCGVCGASTRPARGGHERKCSNESCGAVHFPRTDPAVIMLIHDGADRIVLGRQADWPPGRCSVLAGFVEPGESLEDAVAREVMEEVGLPVAEVTYNSSQPWPFPSSIMLGFSARATATDLKVDLDELESARWFTRDEVANSPEDESFALPRRDSIAYRLIQDWLAAG